MPVHPLLRALALGFTILSTTLCAQVPQILNYQGNIAVGTPPVNFNGSGVFRFALVNTDGTTTFWSNDGTSTAGSQPTAGVTLSVAKGLYSVLLGDTTLTNMTVIPATVFANSDVRLRVWFNDGTANGSQLLSPDQRIAAVGYAMVAGVANGLAAGATVPASAITGTIPASQIAPEPQGMVLIPAGMFLMGNSVTQDADITDAAPVNTSVSAFYMDVTEVTLSQWQAVYFWAKENGYSDLPAGSGKGPNHPVVMLSWYSVVKWCNARSQQAGLTPAYYTDDAQTMIYKTGSVDVTNAQVKWASSGYRLPTEAEWEKAARGGLSGQRFPWGNTISQNMANYIGNINFYSYDIGPNGYNGIGGVGGTPNTTAVGSFSANGYGLQDMAGNVIEWCWDWYGTPYIGGIDPRGVALGSGDAGSREVRGGGWVDYSGSCRVAYRFDNNPGDEDQDLGFRVVRSLAP
jgi:formylglycine-generating enzyme required for sulfatase activity